MKFSIVIPIHNSTETINQCLDSIFKNADKLLSEGHLEFEVIVIDDGSTVPVENYLDKRKYHNLSILTNEENRGYIFSIKKGIAKASGEIIVTMDGDGEHKPKDIPNIVEPIIKNKCDIVFGKRSNIACH